MDYPKGQIIGSSIIDPWTRRFIIHVDKFVGFPKEIARIVAEYESKYVYREWLNYQIESYPEILGNPMLDVLTYFPGLKINLLSNERRYLSRNPYAAKYIRKNLFKFIEEPLIWNNPALFDWLSKKYDLSKQSAECRKAASENPAAVDYILRYMKENPTSDLLTISAANPAGIDYLLTRSDKLRDPELYSNPAAIDAGLLDESKFVEHVRWLSANPHPRAMDFLEKNRYELHINRNVLAGNPGIYKFKLNEDIMNELTRRD